MRSKSSRRNQLKTKKRTKNITRSAAAISKRRLYNPASLDKAIESVRNKSNSINSAAKCYGVPSSTLSDKINGKHPSKIGKPPRIPAVTEKILVAC
jgi:hypothetical protein